MSYNELICRPKGDVFQMVTEVESANQFAGQCERQEPGKEPRGTPARGKSRCRGKEARAQECWYGGGEGPGMRRDFLANDRTAG